MISTHCVIVCVPASLVNSNIAVPGLADVPDKNFMLVWRSLNRTADDGIMVISGRVKWVGYSC